MFDQSNYLLKGIAVLAISFFMFSCQSSEEVISEAEITNPKGCASPTTGYYDDYGHAVGDCDDDDPIVTCEDGTFACTPMECECYD